MKKIKTVREIKVAGKRVFVRVDFNVPHDQEGNITDDTRIVAALPTIQYLLEQEAKVILASHLGRPKGKKNPSYSLKPIADHLAQKVGRPVLFLEECIGPEVEAAVSAMRPGSIILLENLRFHPEEEANDPTFAEALARLAEVYVNDAFGTAHRAHASTAGIAHYLPLKAAGFLIDKELTFLGAKTTHPEQPFVVILGGAKVSGKIEIIQALLDKAETILIGGAMAYTFNRAKGQQVGQSLTETDKIEIAKATLHKAEEKGKKFFLPEDHIVTDTLDPATGTMGQMRHVPGDIPDPWIGVDLGPASIEHYKQEIAVAKTILWNGPMGIFEIDACSKGTFAIAEAVASNAEATSIIGGGDSVKAIKKGGYADRITFISTGGGASLEFLKGKDLPGIKVLDML